MKKLGIAILLMIFGGLNLTIAQKGNTEVRQYFEKEIQPVLETEQQNFYKALTTEELVRINELKAKTNTQMSGNQKGKNGSQKDGKQSHGKRYPKASIDEAKKIADAHPKEMKHFQKEIDKNMEKWMEDITAIRSKESQKGGKGNSGKEFPMFDHLSDPSWLLLWDKDRKSMREQQNGKGRHQGDGRHAKGNCNGKEQGQGMGMKGGGMQNGLGPNQNVNPELRAEIRDYAQENIIPVIAKERMAFDSYLSVAEKEQIALAQGKRKARRIMFKEWYKSEDFEPGARRDDPNFDNMREDMQKSMAEIRAIAKTHEGEIEEALDDIRIYSDTWEREMRVIADKYNGQNQGKHQSQSRQLQQMLNPIHFLLFNPDELESTALFDMDRKDMLEVSVSPNPISNSATIKITGANNMQTEVKLYTKEGGLLKMLYNEMVIGEEISFGFSVTDLENNIYILKISANENVITRKVIVQK